MEYNETTITNSTQSIQMISYIIVDEEIRVSLDNGTIIDLDITNLESVKEAIEKKLWLTLETRITAHKE